MLFFITAMRHPHNSNNYQKLESLLEMSLRSVCAQTDPSFRVIVVCHRNPQIKLADARITYHLIDFPPPCRENMPVTDIQVGFRDKGTKILSGVLLARKLGASHVAFFDADDLISKKVAGFVKANPDSPGWYVNSGYALDYSNWRVQRKYGLIRYCGTTLITNLAELLKASKINSNIDETSTQEQLLAKVPLNIVKHIFGDHQCMAGLFASHGLRMRPFPFPASVWVLRNGENFTVSKNLFRGVPVNQYFKDEFGLNGDGPGINRPSLKDRISEKMDSLRSHLGFLFFGFGAFPKLPVS